MSRTALVFIALLGAVGFLSTFLSVSPYTENWTGFQSGTWTLAWICFGLVCGFGIGVMDSNRSED